MASTGGYGTSARAKQASVETPIFYLLHSHLGVSNELQAHPCGCNRSQADAADFCREKRLEQLRPRLLGNAGAVVAQANANRFLGAQQCGPAMDQNVNGMRPG